MKKKWAFNRKKYGYFIIIFGILFIIPIAIYLLALAIDISFNFPWHTSLNWQSTLNYFGMLYGSLLGFSGIILTILYTQRQAALQKEQADIVRKSDNAISAMPYINMEFQTIATFPATSPNLLKLNAKEDEDSNKKVYVRIKIKNRGRGSATELYLFTQNEENKEYNQLISYDQTSVDFIEVNEQEMLELTIEYDIEKDEKTVYPYLEIRVQYHDIFFNKYIENHNIYFRKQGSLFEEGLISLRSKKICDSKGNTLPIGVESDDRIAIV